MAGKYLIFNQGRKWKVENKKMAVNNNNIRLITGETGLYNPNTDEGWGRNASYNYAQYFKNTEELRKQEKASSDQFIKLLDRTSIAIPFSLVKKFPKLQKINEFFFNKNNEKLQQLREKRNNITENFNIQYSKPQKQEKDNTGGSLDFVDEKGQDHKILVKTGCLLGFADENLKRGEPIPDFLKSSKPDEELATDAAYILLEDAASKHPDEILETGRLEFNPDELDGEVTKAGENIALGLSMKDDKQGFKNNLGQIRKYFGLDEKAKEFIKNKKHNKYNTFSS